MAPIPEGTWDKLPKAQQVKHTTIKRRGRLAVILTKIFIGLQRGAKLRGDLPEMPQGEHQIYRARDERNDFRSKS